MWDIVPYTRGKGLDLGSGVYKAFNHFIGVDSGKQYGGSRVADINCLCDELDLFATDSLDFVFSSHLLEHLIDPGKALREWMRVIKPGGYLVLYLPDEKLYPKVGEEGANPDHKSNLSQKKVIRLMEDVGGWDLVENELRDHDNGPGQRGNEYSFYMVFKKFTHNKHLYSCNDPTPIKTCCVVRYGAFGDMIQTSSVFPGLKKQGYHITLMTTPRGASVAKHDPNIDAFLIQDVDQVPNERLGDFWDCWEKKFDKFINLSESVEGSLLAMPNRRESNWNQAVRHKLMDINYMEFLHTLAEVPFKAPEQRFYATEEETKWATKERDTFPDDVFIMVWAVSGGSLHKETPYVDQVISKILSATPDIGIVILSGERGKVFEKGWEEEPRVFARSDMWPIRKSMAFVHHVDLVVGPETGLLNAVGCEPVPKVCYLSHSSEENLTKHWINTIALHPPVSETPCYPCHMLHYGTSRCTTIPMTDELCERLAVTNEIDGVKLFSEESKVASCVAHTTPDMIFNAIMEHYHQWLEYQHVGDKAIGRL